MMKPTSTIACFDAERAAKAAESAYQNYQKKNYDAAVQEFTEAIKFDDSKFEYYTNRGMSYYGCKQYQEAYNDAKTSLDLEKSSKAVLIYGIAAYALKKDEEAKCAFD